VTSHDPNSLDGPAGYGQDNFVSDTSQLPYQINFENDPTATAPAQQVDITDPLDPNLDWSTFQLTAVGFGNTYIAIPPGRQHYDTTVNVTENDQNFEVVVSLNLDPATGIFTASFQSIDPSTNLPPANLLTGFLAPEDGTGRGIGFVSFTVSPNAGLATGTQIRNVALVTFDLGQSIATDQVNDQDPTQGIDPTKQALVTIDSVPPTSSVSPLPANESTTSFTVTWSGQDDPGGSGVAFYNIYESEDGGPYALWQSDTTQTSATFTGNYGHTYAFYSVATDNVGNQEATPSAAQASTTCFGEPGIALAPSISGPVYGQSLSFTVTVSPATSGLPTPTGTVQFLIDGANFGSPVILVNGAATSQAISALSAAQYTISVSYSGDPDFVASTTSIPLVVAPAVLAVTADNQTMNHGDVVPALTYTVSGFVNGDTSSVVSGSASLITTATSSSPAGYYPITVSAGLLAAANYTFNLVSSTLTVQPKVLDVRLDYGSKSISLIGLNRDLPFATIKAIDVIFSDNVAVNMGQLSLTGANVSSYGFSGFSYNPVTDDATWTLPSAIGVDHLMMALDGETFAAKPTIGVNPFATKFAVLPGDINGDGVVNAQDMVLARNAMLGTGDPSMIGWADLDGNGVVDINDYNAVRKNIGQHL